MGRVGAEDYSVEFTPPDSLSLKGESGDARVTWRRKPNGTVCIETFDGVALNPDSKNPEDSEPDDEEPDSDEETGDQYS